MMEIGAQQRCDNRSLDSLYAWIDTIPLSRPKKIISRDFADGVLVAEVVGHFLPRLVEMHNYPSSSSWSQKKINWQTLNRKIFPKIGMRVSEVVIAQLIDAKPGVIEQVLWDLRLKLQQATEMKVYNVCQRRSITSQSVINSKGNSITIRSELPPRTDDPQLTYRVPKDTRSDDTTTPTNSNRGGKQNGCGFASPVKIDEYPGQEVIPDKLLESPKCSNAGQCGQQGFFTSDAGHQGYVVPPICQISSSGLVNGPLLSPVLDKIQNNNASSSSSSNGGAPAQIIYRGHKMIPLQFLDDKEKEIKALESCNRTLTLKIHRLETLVNNKDQRIEDITHQLQNLRSMYERVTQSVLKHP